MKKQPLCLTSGKVMASAGMRAVSKSEKKTTRFLHCSNYRANQLIDVLSIKLGEFPLS